MLGISPAVASVLMRMYKWNKESLLNAYMNDPDKTLTKCGVLMKVQGGKVRMDEG